LGYGSTFGSQEEIDEYVDNMSEEEIIESYKDSFEDLDIETLKYSLDYAGLTQQFIKEMYKNFVFELWYDYWAAQGIEETRKDIQEIYNQLVNADESNIGNFMAVMSLAINAAHQTGDMTDYISSDTGEGSKEIKRTMDYVSSPEFTKNVDEELQEAGIIARPTPAPTPELIKPIKTPKNTKRKP
jgi:hypothetical protein